MAHRVLKEAVIKDIVYEDYDLSLVKGTKVDKYYQKYLKGVALEKDQMYAIKHWKPTYVLEDGEIIKWKHQLYKKPI